MALASRGNAAQSHRIGQNLTQAPHDSNNPGDKVRTTEQIAQTASTPKMGLSVLLRAFPRVNGSDASLRWCSFALVFLLGGLLAVVFSAAPALAIDTHVFSSSIGGPGSGAGELSLRASEMEGAGSGVAVNATTHDVYVADTENHRVDEFEANGTFVRAWGWGVVTGGLGGFEACTPASLGGCEAGVSGSGPGQFTTPMFIAVDNSTSPSSGDVYVGDSGDGVVSKFTREGVLIDAWGVKGQLKGSPAISFEALMGLTVDSSGALDVLVNKGDDGEPHSLLKFTQEKGSFSEEFEVARANAPHGVAVADSGNLFKVNLFPTVEELSPSGAKIGQVTKEETATGVAAAGSDLYVDAGGFVEHFTFTAPEVVAQRGGESCTIEEAGEGCSASDTFGSEQLKGGAGIAVDQGDSSVLVADAATNAIDVFTAETVPGEVLTEQASGQQPTAVTLNGMVDPEGLTLKAGVGGCGFEWGETTAYGHIAGCEPSNPSGSSPVSVKAALTGLQPDTLYHYRLLAADSEGAAHGQDAMFETTGPPTIDSQFEGAVTRTSAAIHIQIDPHGFATHYQVEYGTTSSFGSSTTVEELGPETTPQNVEVPLTGLTLGTTYHYRVVASNEAGGKTNVTDGPEKRFTTLSAAPIDQEEVVSVSSSEAIVAARIDALGEPTSYTVEYGTSEAYGHSASEHSVGAATEAVSVTEKLTGLELGTTYHFRFAAHNHDGVTDATDATFKTTATSSTAGLPDNRQYELVSSTHEPVESYVPQSGYSSQSDDSTSQPFRAAVDGDAVAFMGEPPAVGGNGSIGLGGGDQWLATRGNEGGWNAGAITPAGSEVGTAFQAFSEDLSSGILETRVQPTLAAGAPACGTKYTGDLYAGTPGGYRALFTSTNTPGNCGNPLFAGASADGSQVFFQDQAALTPNAVENTEVPASHSNHSFERGATEGEPCEIGCNLYESVAQGLKLVDQLPEGGGVPRSASFGGFSRVNRERPSFSRAISSDGSRVFWTDTQEGPDMERVFVLENGSTETPVSAGPAEYWTATPDGRYAFYTEAGVLWRFDTTTNTREALAKTGVKGEAADVQGVIGTNTTGEDGAYVYFVAGGVLAANENQQKEQAIPQACGSNRTLCNLYVLHDGVTSFIATLAAQDNSLETGFLETGGDWTLSGSIRISQVAPDGRHLLFVSTRSLVGYEGDGHTEAYVYDADADKLTCASCDPGGAAPSLVVSGGDVALPLSPLPISSVDSYVPRWMSADGSRVFFETDQPLVHSDSNGHGDVYEWEQEGIGSCRVATSVFGGCVYLLSGGSSSDASVFLDASADGSDVFFESRAELTGQDRGGLMQLFDVHECSAAAPCAANVSTACTGTGCQGVPPSPPSFAAPASVTFAGPGNFSPRPSGKPKPKAKKPVKCAKAKKRNKHHQCVKVKTEHKETKKAGRASHDRRGNS
jgi:NHL repeat